MVLYAAFVLGLMGSLHCLAMCGPLAIALPVRTNNVWVKAAKYLSYHTARTLTYGLLGLAMGAIGKGFVLAGFQQTLSIVSGLLVFLSVVVIYYPTKLSWNNKMVFTYSHKIKSAFIKYFKSAHWYTLPVLGLLNGLLPCGMVYTALLGAWGTGSALVGMGFMIAFGLGTLPFMMGISLLGNFIDAGTRNLLSKISPVLACTVGILLIVRGLGLDIPLVSPANSDNQIKCCQLK